jgi:predicted O-methyltransferase YrrM
MSTTEIDGQLNPQERAFLAEAIRMAAKKPEIVIEVGTWLGGGSTVTILRALGGNGTGHLWGIEANPSIYERMMANLRTQAPEVIHRFTPLFGYSTEVLPRWIEAQKKPLEIDMAFLDGGNSPAEQIVEFDLLDPYLPVGGQLFGHDANHRKGKFLVPYVARLDNWESRVHDFAPEGMMYARKIAAQPSPASLRAAKAHLFKIRWQPMEIAARFAPQGLKVFIFNVMPKRFAQRIADGRK